MSGTLAPPTAPPSDRLEGDGGEPTATPGGGPERQDAGAAPQGRTILLTATAAALAAAAAGWMVAGVFEGGTARLVAVAGALAGAALAALSYRLRQPAVAQYLALPLAATLGAMAVVLERGSGADLVGLVVDALFSGGIAQPPVPFDPGWRFLLAVVTTLLGAGATGVALGFGRPKLAVAVPVPLVFAGALVQPAGGEAVSTVVAFVLVIAGLAVAYGVELGDSGVSSGRFELLRLLRGAGALGALALGLVLLANAATFLLPETAEDRVIPPQRPPAAPPQADRELFTVDTDRVLPWRLGVLDVYEDGAWKTPPFDPDRLVTLPPRAEELPGETGAGGDTVTVTFRASELSGRVLPTLAVPHAIRVTAGEGAVRFDPRTQSLHLEQLAESGLTYEVEAAAPATSAELAAAPAPGPAMAPFLAAPPPPLAVQELLADAPTDDLFGRLQFVRQAFYDRVLAAGAGRPVDVPPARVVEILDGAEATPYEITAAEALLARWAGVPSRLGYGYFGGDPLEDGSGYVLRPRHGATYLEVHFEGEGWVPIVGKPPRAKSSFSDTEKNDDPAVRPTDELALITYVPVRLTSFTLLFETVRHYLAQAVPAALAAGAVLAFYPGLLRALRRRRRRRWAATRGPAGRIAVSYTELRDTAWDLNIGHPAQTPLEFVGEIAEDAEHAELAWLVTRALWGDLSRDLRDRDAEAAEELAASVRRRLRAAQPAVGRVLAVASRASLRDPYSDDLPNAWWRLDLAGRVARVRGRVRDVLGRVSRRVPRPRRRRLRLPRGASGLLLLLALLVTGCAAPLDLAAPSDPAVLPDPAVPDAIDGIVLQREPSAEVAFEDGGPEALVTAGAVYTVRRGDTIEASLQLGALRPGLYGREEDVRRGLLSGLGGGRFEPIRLGDDRVNAVESLEQRLLLWFSPDGRYYQLLVARKSFQEADALLAAVLAFQRGEEVTGLDRILRRAAPDPRRGFPL